MKYLFNLPKFQFFTGSLCALTLLFSSCKKDDNDGEQPVMIAEMDYYLLTESNSLMKYNGANPNMMAASVDITGLASGDRIISIDFRPATGQLYGLGSQSRLYVINPDNGMATVVGQESFSPEIASANALIDFNPTVDRIRLLADNGQNLRLHPETGMVAFTDGSINGVTGASIAGAAYTNSKAGATSTVLYDIDATTQKLYKQDPPNDGVLVEVGDLNVDFSGTAAFDISFDNQMAIAVLETAQGSRLYSINVNTGRASWVANLSQNIIGLAIQSAPTAYATDASNNLIIFNPMNPEDRVSKPATGVVSGDMIVGLDFRPATHQLYALGSTGRIYSVNTASAAFAPVGSVFATALLGTDFGFDFNPTVDRIRLVSNAGQNLRLNPNDGLVAAIDGVLNPGTPMVSAAAYTNSVPGATTTELFVVDGMAGKLYKQDPPNAGGLVEIGNLGSNFTGSNGFDIGGRTGNAYGIFTSGNATGVYSVNLTNGQATMVTSFNGSVTAMALAPGM